MQQVLLEMLQPAVLPATILLGLVVLYWTLVIAGAAAVDTLDIDLGADGSGLDHVPVGAWAGVLQFFHLRHIPVTVVASVLVLFLWTGAMIGNQWWNPQRELPRGLLLLAGAAAASAVATRLVLLPLVPVFRGLNEEDVRRIAPGQRARVTSSEVTDTFGEITIEQSGPPVVLHARCQGARLPRGELVELVSYNSESNTWLVQLSKKSGPDS